eukprot:jgi/Tetstr1/461479/TSEL_006585.t1
MFTYGTWKCAAGNEASGGVNAGISRKARGTGVTVVKLNIGVYVPCLSPLLVAHRERSTAVPSASAAMAADLTDAFDETAMGEEEEEEEEEDAYGEGDLHEVRRENSQLKKNFDNLKEIHLGVQEANQKLQQRYNSLYQERVEVERQYQQLCESWRLELEQKQKQFDEARKQIMQPRDLELLRLKMLEEVEAPFKQKCHALAKEAEAGQEAFVRLRREHEKLRNEMGASASRHQEKVDELHIEHEKQLRDVREQLVQLKASSVPRSEVEKKVATLRHEANNQEVLVKRYREEVAELRKEREAAVMEKDSALADCEKKLFRLRENDVGLSAQVESLLRKNRHLAKELEDSETASERTHAELLKAQAVADSLQSQLQDMRANAEAERMRNEERMHDVSRHAEDRAGQLTLELMEKNRRIAELELQSKEKVQQVEASSAAQLRVVREKHEVAAAGLEAENRTLKGEVAAMKNTHAREAGVLGERLAEAKADMERAKQDADRAQHAADSLQLDKERLRAELAESQAMLERSGRWPEDKRLLEGRLQALEGAAEAWRAEKQELRESLADKEQQLQEYQRMWEHEAASHVGALEESKRSWALEKSLVVKKANEATRRWVL